MIKEPRAKPFSLDMNFDEAMERFFGTDPGELPDKIKLSKKPAPKKKGDEEPPPSKVDRDDEP